MFDVGIPTRNILDKVISLEFPQAVWNLDRKNNGVTKSGCSSMMVRQGISTQYTRWQLTNRPKCYTLWLKKWIIVH